MRILNILRRRKQEAAAAVRKDCHDEFEALLLAVREMG